MNKKFFLIDPSINFSNQDEIEKQHEDFTKSVNNNWERREQVKDAAIQNFPPLKATFGRVVIKVDIEYKNYAAFNGSKIRLERQFNELDRKKTEPVNAIVVDAANIPSGAEVLIHHNSLHDSNRIFDCEDLVEGEVSTDIRYYSIKENECFLWREGTGDWQPCTIFATALRVYKPYEGSLENIPHTQLKNTLYVTSGLLKGSVVSTLKGCDYEIIFNDEKSVEHRVIRFRPFGDIENEREPEAICVLNDITSLVENGKYFVGLNDKDCKAIK